MWRENDPFVMGINIWQGVESTVRGGGKVGDRPFLVEYEQLFGYWGFLQIPSARKTLLIILIA